LNQQRKEVTPKGYRVKVSLLKLKTKSPTWEAKKGKDQKNGKEKIKMGGPKIYPQTRQVSSTFTKTKKKQTPQFKEHQGYTTKQ